MRSKQNIEIYNEEVREIMKEIPGSLLRWGLTVIFLIFILIIVGSYFFSYKEVVSAPIVLTTSNPPASLISKASGRISQWFVVDGDKIKRGGKVAIVENPTILTDLLFLENIIIQLDTLQIEDGLYNIVLPKDVVLGNLQNQYNNFYNNWMNYKEYIDHNLLPQKIELLEQQIEKQKQYYNLSLEQKEMIEKEMEMEKRRMKRHRIVMEKGGMSEAEFEEAESGISQSQRNYVAFLASLKSTEISMINQKSSLFELQEQHYNNIEQYKLDIESDLRLLKNMINDWEKTYLLTSPISGTVTLTKYWSENHVVTAGERLATIVPDNTNSIICRANVSSSDIPKIKVGQTVHVKLAGYPYMEHGMLTGQVQTMSLVPEDDEYIVEIGLKGGMISNYSEQLKLVQEMDGTAEIITQEIRMIYRLIAPLRTILN